MPKIERYLSIVPKMEYISSFDPIPSSEWEGIKALWYEGAEYHGKKTKVFAYIGYPQEIEHKKVPAVVLVHGGGGHAYAEWIRQWNQRGYAAIAMDTTGFIPSPQCIGLTGTEAGKYEQYVRYFHHGLEDEKYTVGPDNDELQQVDLPREEQWIYHAVADTILAHNILREDKHINGEQIGISGVSWGSVVTALAIGYDTRYAFAIAFYGSGYLGKVETRLTRIFNNDRIKEQWLAEDRFHKVTFPVLWVCTLQDQCFGVESNSCSYVATKSSGSVLSIHEKLEHSHIDAWSLEEGYCFADAVLNNRRSFVYPVIEPKSFGTVVCKIVKPKNARNVKARAICFDDEFVFHESGKMVNKWHEIPAEIDGDTVFVEIPPNVFSYYIEFTTQINDKSYITTTKIEKRTKRN